MSKGIKKGSKIMVIKSNRPVILTVKECGTVDREGEVVWTEEREGYFLITECYTFHDVMDMFGIAMAMSEPFKELWDNKEDDWWDEDEFCVSKDHIELFEDEPIE